MVRDDWKHTKLKLLEMAYGRQAKAWNNLYPPVNDDRRVYIVIYHQIVDAVNSLPDNPHAMVCVAMNHQINEETKTLDKIQATFSET